ncbi:alpha/beta hydrolase [Halalkalibacter kiskunsagensis]|uniref:Alpha/beta hydrolase n=1 Tax=Halalkalibacter kiskunsagensis TaxID=1548599 RepID=A0ABV6KDJ4_9BACI
MNKWLSVFLDKVGLHLLHRKRSVLPQFRNHFDLQSFTAMNRDSFYHVRSVPSLSFELSYHEHYLSGCYKFDSPIHSGDADNENTSGICYLSKRNEEPVHVIMVHGWRSDNLNNFKAIFLKQMLRRNYHVYFPTLPYHFNRTAGGLYSGEYMISANVGRTVTAIRQAVLEIRALIQWLKQHKGGKIILIGISLGGYLSNLISLYEKEIDALVSVMYANDLSFEIWHTPIGRYIKQDLEIHGFTYEKLRQSWSIIRTDEQQPLISKEKILLISGEFDQYIMEKDAKGLWSAWGEPQRLLYPYGHAGIIFNRKQIAKDTLKFIDSIVTEGSSYVDCIYHHTHST